MKTHRARLLLLAATAVIVAGATGVFVAAAPAAGVPGSVTKSRTLSTTDIVCDGTVDVTVTLDGTPGSTGTETDVLLVMDQSGSVRSNLTTAKNVAKSIVDGIDLTRNRVGLVVFAKEARVVSAAANATDGTSLKADIEAIPYTPPGTDATNHADAFLKAQAAFSGSAPRVIVMITDGKTTRGNRNGVNDVTEANEAAKAARDAGTSVFAVRLGGSSSKDATMKGWASDPDQTFFARAAPSPAAAIVTAIGPETETPAATGVVVSDTLGPDFDFVSSTAGAYDTASRTLTWTVGTLDDTPQALTYTVRHNKPVLGVSAKPTSLSVTYTSDQEASAALSNPAVFVRPCGEILAPPQACNAGSSCTLDPELTEATQQETGIADVNLDAGSGDTTLFLTKLSAVPAGVCGGGFTNSFVQADVLPLTDKLVVTLYIPQPSSGPLFGLAKICLGTNLPFRTFGFGTADQAADGLYYGILPYGPSFTRVDGSWVRSPSIAIQQSDNLITIRGVTTRVTKVVFEVYNVGKPGSDGNPGYDPKWGVN